MIDNSRRRVLLGGLFPFALLSKLTIPSKYEAGNLFLSIGERNELEFIYREWIQKENDEPKRVIAELQLDLNDRKNLLNTFSRDFEEGNIFIVKGLVLSFSEAAILASIGSLISNQN